MGNPWTEEEKEIIKKYYPTEGRKICERLPNRSWDTIKSFAYKNNISILYNTFDLTGDYGIGYSFKQKAFFFDLDKYELIKNYTWCVAKDGYVWARIKGEKGTISLHRLVMGGKNIPKDLVVDHINHNPSDNRICNLRLVTPDANSKNKRIIPNTSHIYPGVTKNKSGTYSVSIGCNNKSHHIGTFKTVEEAIRAKIDAEHKYFGQYRNTELDQIVENMDIPQSISQKNIIINAKWDDEEVNILKKYYPTEGRDVYKRLPNKTVQQCITKAKNLKIKYIGAQWTTEELSLVMELFPKYGIKKCCEQINKSINVIKHKAYDLKLFSPIWWTPDELDVLKKYYPIEGKKCADRLPNKNEKQVLARACKEKIKFENDIKNIWTEEEIKIVAEYYPTEGNRCQKRLPSKTKQQITSRAQYDKIKYIGNKSNTEEYTQVNLFD